MTELSRRHLFHAAGGVGAALLAAACSAPPSTAGAASGSAAPRRRDLKQVGLDYPFTFLPVYAGVTKFARQRAGELNLALQLTNDNAQLETQAANLTAWVSQGMDAIVCFPLEDTSIEQQARAALDAGLVWVSYGGTMKNQSASIEFSFRSGGEQLGRAAAKWANEVLGGRGKIAFLVDDVIQLGRERTAGMVEAFTSDAPDVQVVGKEQAISPDQGLTATNAVLAKHPDLNLVLGVTDDAASGAYRALRQAGRAETDPKTFVGGQDGGQGSLQLVKQGTFYRASAALALRDIGRAVIDVPVAAAAGKPNPSVQVPIALVRAGDPKIDELLAQYS